MDTNSKYSVGVGGRPTRRLTAVCRCVACKWLGYGVTSRSFDNVPTSRGMRRRPPWCCCWRWCKGHMVPWRDETSTKHDAVGHKQSGERFISCRGACAGKHGSEASCFEERGSEFEVLVWPSVNWWWAWMTPIALVAMAMNWWWGGGFGVRVWEGFANQRCRIRLLCWPPQDTIIPSASGKLPLGDAIAHFSMRIR